MKPKKWEVDENGMLIGARAHDSYLQAVEFIEQHSLRLDFRRVDGTEVRLQFSGIKEITLATIWERSILLDVFTWPVSHVPDSVAADVGWNALLGSKTSSTTRPSVVKSIVDRDQQQFLSTISFAHGVTSAVVFKQMSIFELGE